MLRAMVSQRRRYFSGAEQPSIVVTVPARDEQDHIGRCLAALANQRQNACTGVVLLLNNCRDRSFEVACEAVAKLPLLIRIYDASLPLEASHAGGARRAAMELGAAWLEEGNPHHGLLLTTDADSRTPEDWVASNQAAIAQGVDAVAGRLELDPQDAAALPGCLHARGRLEAQYEALLTELFAHLDPRSHDPWPRHVAEPGASLAVTLQAYRVVGGMPSIPLGEDRALVAALESRGFLVRHDPAVSVVTSGRTVGRAGGGVADTLRLRCAQPEAPCDPYLEPVRRAYFRGLWRGRLRRQRALGLLTPIGEWTGALGLLPSDAERVLTATSFVQLWCEVERTSPRLVRRALAPSGLPLQIRRAQALLRILRETVPLDPISNTVINEIIGLPQPAAECHHV